MSPRFKRPVSPLMRAAPFLFVLLWSGGFAFGKWGLTGAEPLTFLCLRYALVILILLPAAAVIRPPWPRGRGWRDLAVTGVLIQGFYFGFDYLALEWGASAGTVALISALQPVLIGLLAPWLTGDRTRWRQWVGLLLGLGGAAIVILARSGVQSAPPAAFAAAFGGLFGMTAATLYERRFGGGQHMVTVNIVQCLVGLALLLPLAALTETMHVRISLPFAASLAYLVVGNSLISLTLLLLMLRTGTAASVSALFFLIPPFAGVMDWLMLGESMPPLGWGGMVLAACGVALATRIQPESPMPAQETNPSA